MADLIDRQAVIDVVENIDCSDGVGISTLKFEAIDDAVTAIKALPSAQPEIIRCKDCAKRKYCRTSTIWAVSPNDDWYCADAERRNDG